MTRTPPPNSGIIPHTLQNAIHKVHDLVRNHGQLVNDDHLCMTQSPTGRMGHASHDTFCTVKTTPYPHDRVQRPPGNVPSRQSSGNTHQHQALCILLGDTMRLAQHGQQP
eukprot:189276-Chlamydomonas_euryale.AAC.1